MVGRARSRSLVLAGRRPPGDKAGETIAALTELGVRVLAVVCDVARETEVRGLLDQIQGISPPLRGVFHLAGARRWGDSAAKLGPLCHGLWAKVLGSWNLHRLTRQIPLDCFVLYSSWASMLRPPGHANYSAANSFMDALAWHRRALGLPALSINWGAWAEVGEAAWGDITRLLARKGIGSFSLAHGHETLGRLLSEGACQVGVMSLDVERWRRSRRRRLRSC